MAILFRHPSGSRDPYLLEVAAVKAACAQHLTQICHLLIKHFVEGVSCQYLAIVQLRVVSDPLPHLQFGARLGQTTL